MSEIAAPLSPEDVAVPRTQVRALRLPDGGLTVYRGSTSTAFVMNLTAALVWGELDGRRSVAEVIRRLEEQHGAVPTLAGDVTAIVAEFAAADLVTTRPSDDA